MKIQHFDIQAPNTKPPKGWTQLWSGKLRLTECWNDTLTNVSEQEFERDCFLSVLNDIEREEVSLIEVGAGYGEWCLALAGTIENKLIDCVPTKYKCLAIEAEPKHYEWCRKHFAAQHINGNVIFGAVSNKNGECRFNSETNPAKHYGQSMSFAINEGSLRERVSQTLVGVRNLVKGKAVKVPMFTLDSLIREHANIVHMDVQGAELKVLEGARESIERGLIDYWLIGTHKREYNDVIKRMLEHKYECVVSLLPFSTNAFDGRVVKCNDGIQLWRRRHNEILDCFRQSKAGTFSA